MLDHTIANYLFIRGVILAFQAVTPVCIFIASFSIAEPPRTPFRRFLLVWALIEIIFWVGVYIPRKRALQAEALHPPPLNKEERKELFWKCWDKIPHPEYFLSRWFLGANPSEIKRGNVREFYEWALLNRGQESENDKIKRRQEHAEECGEEDEELESFVDGIETLLGRTLEPGHGSAKSMRLTVDEVNMSHRPVLWYVIVMIVDTYTAVRLRYSGFFLYRQHLRSAFSVFPPRPANLATRYISPAPDLSYWYRLHTSKTRLPILFVHGIGIGLYPYAKFMDEINTYDPQAGEDGQIGIIAVELMPISFRITGPILDHGEICRQINMILERHGFDNVVLMSHSYGSVVSTHLLQDPATASKIGPMLFVDPVTFLLHLPDVAYNFTARKPKAANEHQLYYFASLDMMVAHTLARHFFWAHNLLWKEDLRGRDVTISLGGRDLIVDTETVGKYVNGKDLKSEDKEWMQNEWNGSGVETIWWPTVDHAQVFERADGRHKLAHVLREYCKRRDVDEVEAHA